MSKGNKFDPRGFSLVLTLPNGKVQKVNIPKIKRGFGHEVVGGKITYQMAIDNYTISFKDKNELLDDIRKNGYARIKSVQNKDIKVSTIYNGELITNPIVYSDSENLAYFINNSSIGGSFGFEGSNHRTAAYEVISEFKKRVIDMYYNSEFGVYYQRYLKSVQSFREISLYDALKIGYDEEEYAQSGRYFLLREDPFYYYENIRNHLLTDYKQLEIDFAYKRYDDSPFNEKVEARKDLEESLDQISRKYDKKEKSVKPLEISEKQPLDFSKIPGPYTVDPEEQMEMLNHPSAQDIIDEEIALKVRRFDKIYDLIANYEDSLYNPDVQSPISDEEYDRYLQELSDLTQYLDNVFPSEDDEFEEDFLEIPDSEIVPYEKLGTAENFDGEKESFSDLSADIKRHK